MRGPRRQNLGLTNARGITPAYAGTTPCCGHDASQRGDHPRLCGDHLDKFTDWTCLTGSPPLMRGPQCSLAQLYAYLRITPAYAGTTAMPGVIAIYFWDHPRLCGDHIVQLMHTREAEGSPPLMRGPRIHIPSTFPVVRITPAYAGTTRTRSRSVCMLWDHPRLCGDHLTEQYVYSFDDGSPPLMRGPQAIWPLDQGYGRITPAYAGTTFKKACQLSKSGDHPRLCGDHSSWPSGSSDSGGSPPLMRGPLLPYPARKPA